MKSKKHKKHDDRHKSDYDDSQHRPLKLVLKVGSSTSSNNIGIARKKKKSKKHKHRHRSHHSKSPSTSQHHTRDEQSYVPPLLIKTHTFPNDVNQSLPSKSPPTSRLASTGGKTNSESQFNQFLGDLLKLIQKRDTYDFFGKPVTDEIAPDYSSIISHPMDFSTMKRKLDQGLYQILDYFRSDVKLICQNAMAYNLPDTIYFKEARKLRHFIDCKIYNKKFLSEVAKPYPDISPDQFDTEENPTMNIEPSILPVPDIENSQDTVCSMDSQKISDKEMDDSSETKPTNDEELTAEQILASVKIASDRLKRPVRSHLSYLRQKNDGTTTLSVIGSQERERTVTLGSLAGQLSDGISCLPPYKEPEENRVNLVDSVPTEPFSSFLPSVDSTFANFSQEETQLLRSTYGDDNSFDYVKSIVSFAGDNSYALYQVDELLEDMTDGQHSKTMSKIRDLRMKREENEEEKKQKTNENKNEHKDERESANEPYKLVLSDISSDEDRPEDNSAQFILNDFQTVNMQHSVSSEQPTSSTNDEMKSNEVPCDENPMLIDSQNHEATNQPTAVDLEAIINELKLLQNY